MKTITWGVAKHQWLFKHIYAMCLYKLEFCGLEPQIWFLQLASLLSGGSELWLLHKYSGALWEFCSCKRFCSVSLGMKAKSPSHIPVAQRWGNYCCPHCCERLLTVKLFRYGANWATYPQRHFWSWKKYHIPAFFNFFFIVFSLLSEASCIFYRGVTNSVSY